ncbi:hypothetical protein J7L70_07610 [Candidatus Bathyarchaeota archaeon]|nr:hypothetical protein [Candidatus Bathyarchaeota archaeon]
MFSVLVVVACGRRKIWDVNPSAGAVSARDAYIGAPFRVNRRYAERFADRWVILSAKYGFIDPDFEIPENYNVTFKDPSTKPITVEELRKQVLEKKLYEHPIVLVLGSRIYARIVAEAFSGFDVKIKAPLAGLPIGKAMRKVKQALERGKPFDCDEVAENVHPS